MMRHYQVREHRLCWILGIFLLWFAAASSHGNIPSNHQTTPDASTLKIEAKESEASITLGKDLILGPSLPTAASIVSNSSGFNDIATTKIATPAIVNRESVGEYSASVARRPVPKDASPRWSHIVDNRHWVGKDSRTAWKRDSYLEALRHSRIDGDQREGIVAWTDSRTKANRREYAPGPIYKPEIEYGSPDSTYASKNPRIAYAGPVASSANGDSYPQSLKPSMDFNGQYGAPQNSYGPPQNPYGPPQNPYGLPQNSYGSPGVSFYPQTPYGSSGSSYSPAQQAYGTSIHASPPVPIYSAPYALPDVSHFSILPTLDLGWPLALKLNAFTLAKIVLKLVIFKMIVKFIAVICLLLFIPKLELLKKKANKDDEEEERSSSSPYASLKTLNDLESTMSSSVEKYEAQNGARSGSTRKCTTLGCRITEALVFHESWEDYLNLLKSYAEEERRITERKEQ